MKKLKLIIQPKIIDHLGINMYQKPVDVISELIANSWDADAEKVTVQISDNCVKIIDNGHGMTFNECQYHFLTVGRDRREELGTDKSKGKKRTLLGRKGIGKLASFGIVNEIIIDTIAEENGEHTTFKMDLKRIKKADDLDNSEKDIEVIRAEEKNEAKKDKHGTTITLDNISIKGTHQELAQKLGRRFLLTQNYNDFKVMIDDEPMPDSFSESMEFSFPESLEVSEKAKFNINIVDGWAEEIFEGNKIYWRIGTYEDTIKDEELRGISIFANGKLAQKPFFFDLAGGISAQNSIEYMTGQVRMDFIDSGDNDLISTERQRINLQTDLGKKIQAWGIGLIKNIGNIWKFRRAEKKKRILQDKIEGFNARLERLGKNERRTVESVLLKIASFDRLGQKRFKDWCNAVLTSWEGGRLKELISELANEEELDETKFIEILTEADVVTALNMAEAVKTKIAAIQQLNQYVSEKSLENEIRDFIYKRPWLIHPKWESYRKERSVENIIKDVGVKELDNNDAFNGRVDLVLSAGSSLLIIEFMRPGLKLDRDHLTRLDYYFTSIETQLQKNSVLPFKRIDGAYVVADNHNTDEIITKIIGRLEERKIKVMSWKVLIGEAIKLWEFYIDIIKERNPNDERIKGL
jgi:hypothetical protein